MQLTNLKNLQHQKNYSKKKEKDRQLRTQLDFLEEDIMFIMVLRENYFQQKN